MHPSTPRLPSSLRVLLLSLVVAASSACAQAEHESTIPDMTTDSGAADSQADNSTDNGEDASDENDDTDSSTVDSSKPDTGKHDSGKADTGVADTGSDDDSSVPDGGIMCGSTVCRASVLCKDTKTGIFSFSLTGCCGANDACGAIPTDAAVGCVAIASVESLLGADCHSQ